MSTAGFFTSSARVDTQSKPMKEKNTKEAPSNMLQGGREEGGGRKALGGGKGARVITWGRDGSENVLQELTMQLLAQWRGERNMP
jgi:hypothetical protein